MLTDEQVAALAAALIKIGNNHEDFSATFDRVLQKLRTAGQ